MLPIHNCANTTGDRARALCLLVVLAMGCSNVPAAEKINADRDPVDFVVTRKIDANGMRAVARYERTETLGDFPHGLLPGEALPTVLGTPYG